MQIALSSVSGSEYSSVYEMLECETILSDTVSLESVSLSITDGLVSFYAVLVSGVTETEIVSTGNIYGFSGGFVDGDYYLIDFNDTADVVFVQAKVDTTTTPPSLYLGLQKVSDHSFVEFTISLNRSFVSAVISESDDSDKAKTLGLYRIENNVIDATGVSTTIEASGNEILSIFSAVANSDLTQGSMITQAASTVPYSTWTSFFNRLNNYGYTYLSTYAIDTSVILANGWTFLSNNASAPYAISSYSVQNGSGQRLIQIIRLNITFHNLATASGFQVSAEDIMSLSYNENTGRIDVLYYNFGPYLDNIKIGVNCNTSGQTVYNKETITNALGTPASSLKLFAGIIPHASTISDIWSVLDSGIVVNGNSGSYVRLFEQTYALQLVEYQNKVVRAVAATSGTYSIEAEGHYMTIEGQLNAGYSGCASWAYSYSHHVT
jgi:hypothetical protein